jgi:hypothetical protein
MQVRPVEDREHQQDHQSATVADAEDLHDFQGTRQCSHSAAMAQNDSSAPVIHRKAGDVGALRATRLPAGAQGRRQLMQPPPTGHPDGGEALE